MKICVIDVGSNSVRLALLADGKTLYKRLATTRLGEGLSFSGEMSADAMDRTAHAIADFKARALAEGAEKIYVFATAAVRSASNRAEFLERVKSLCGIEVDVISGEQEAAVGILGALKGRDGGIIDAGGASTEITVQSGGKVLYSSSVNIGVVRLHDLAGRNSEMLVEKISERLPEYGAFSADCFDMYAIGGTATTIASVKHGLKVYDPAVVDGTRISAAEIGVMADRLLSLPVEEVRKIDGMDPLRADVIGGGCLLLKMIMEKFGIKEITVSESDNIEGYFMQKEGCI